jgi:hypothetical protein
MSLSIDYSFGNLSAESQISRRPKNLFIQIKKINATKPNELLEVVRYFGKNFISGTIYCVFFD